MPAQTVRTRAHPPASSVDEAVDAAASVVSAYFGALLPLLEEHAAHVAEALGAHAREGLTASRVDDLVEPHAHAVLDRTSEAVYGAGFIATVDLLSDTASHLSWWQGGERRKLVFPAESVKQGIDYRELDWFRIPMLTGRPYVAGPYVDYLCSDEYTMTAAAPVTVDGVFLGVAGLDVLIDAIERRLTPPLRALATPIVLVNEVQRVVVSTDARLSAGDVLRPVAVRELARRACEGVGLAVVALA